MIRVAVRSGKYTGERYFSVEQVASLPQSCLANWSVHPLQRLRRKPATHATEMTAMPTRREFLGSAAAGGLAASYTATANGFAANETINVGCIGTGGRCRRLMESLRTIPGVK